MLADKIRNQGTDRYIFTHVNTNIPSRLTYKRFDYTATLDTSGNNGLPERIPTLLDLHLKAQTNI